MTFCNVCDKCGRPFKEPATYKKVDVKHKAAKAKSDEAIRLHGEGLNPHEISEKISAHHMSVRHYLYSAGIKPHRCERLRGNTARDKEIIALFKSGKILEEIGQIYHISRERIRQVLKKQKIDPLDGGRKIRSFINIDYRANKKNKALENKNKRCFAAWALSAEEYDVHVAEFGNTTTIKSPMRSFRNQKNAASRDGIPWMLDFKTWWNIWLESGKWNERGRGRGYVMGRFGGIGPYAVENVRIVTAAQNASDSYIMHSAEERMAKAHQTRLRNKQS